MAGQTDEGRDQKPGGAALNPSAQALVWDLRQFDPDPRPCLGLCPAAQQMAMGWEDIFKLTGLKRTKANRAYLNKLSRAGNLPFSGLRNPASDPIAQTGAILNMVTPDILKAASLDIPTTSHPVLFHPHQVQRQGGDNDSDMSQVYMVMQKMAGELVNGFG
ncbi:MAG: hypothetical protein HS126_22030 [Anaerolineales bacterium]|nr:hypothetical protein [Anaerolineales bacterium]